MPGRENRAAAMALGRRSAQGLAATLLVVGFALGTAPARACGYHNPAAIALGVLNWVYPDALHLRTAVWQAEDAGILPPRRKGPHNDLFAFHRAVTAMQNLSRQILIQPAPGDTGYAFSIVLLESVMWTNFYAGDDGIAIEVHADGARPGNVVVVTDLKVVRAMLNGTLTFSMAQAHGLLRFYGDPAEQRSVRALFATFDRSSGDVATHPPALPAGTAPSPGRL
ncbi:MAG: hypothetical protein ACFCUW_15570 [Kiloniellaceae bacterium]